MQITTSRRGCDSSVRTSHWAPSGGPEQHEASEQRVGGPSNTPRQAIFRARTLGPLATCFVRIDRVIVSVVSSLQPVCRRYARSTLAPSVCATSAIRAPTRHSCRRTVNALTRLERPHGSATADLSTIAVSHRLPVEPVRRRHVPAIRDERLGAHTRR